MSHTRRSVRSRAGVVLAAAALLGAAYSGVSAGAPAKKSGRIVLSHNGPWTLNEAYNPAFVRDDVASVELESAGPGPAGAVHHLVAPVNLGMEIYGLENLRLCYRIQSLGGASDKIEATEVWEQHAGLAISVIDDTTDRTETASAGECFDIAPSAPYVPTDEGSLVVNVVHQSDTAGDRLHLYGVTTTWVSTGAAPK